MNEVLLKLLAADAEDIQVISAVIQDSIAPVCDMTYQKADKSFIMVVQRFRWDCVDEEGRPVSPDEECASCVYERISCALDLEGVEAVQYQGFDLENPSAMLDLLTMILVGDELQMVFAGGAKLRLKLGNWRLKLQDFGESWPTTHRPRHAT